MSFLASSTFLGAILSTLRIYGYTFEKIASNNFSCLSHARHSCQRLTRLLFSGFMDILFGSATGFIGAIFKAKMAHPHIKKV